MAKLLAVQAPFSTKNLVLTAARRQWKRSRAASKLCAARIHKPCRFLATEHGSQAAPRRDGSAQRRSRRYANTPGGQQITRMVSVSQIINRASVKFRSRAPKSSLADVGCGREHRQAAGRVALVMLLLLPGA